MTHQEIEDLMITLDCQFVRSLRSANEWTIHYQHGFVLVELDEEGDLIRFATSPLVDLDGLRDVDQHRWMLAAMIQNSRTRLGRLVGIPSLAFEAVIWLDGGGKLTSGQFVRALALAVSQLAHGRASLDEVLEAIPERPPFSFPSTRLPPPSLN